MSDDDEAKQWVSSDGRVLSNLDLRVYARAGLDPPAAILWADRGIAPYAANSFRSHGIGLAEASLLVELGLKPTERALVQELSLADLSTEEALRVESGS